MKKHGDRQRKRIPRDGEAMCDILEFICGRLGIRLSFLEYVSEGVSMDDDGGFIDKVDACLDATNLDMDDIRQRLSSQDGEIQALRNALSDVEDLRPWVGKNHDSIEDLKQSVPKIENPSTEAMGSVGWTMKPDSEVKKPGSVSAKRGRPKNVKKVQDES